MVIKNCQTVEQYKIMRWIDESFEPDSMEVCFTGRNTATITDIAGEKAKLFFSKSEQRVILEELELK